MSLNTSRNKAIKPRLTTVAMMVYDSDMVYSPEMPPDGSYGHLRGLVGNLSQNATLDVR